MRKSRRIQLAGLVALAGTGAAGAAAADDLSISTAQTNPVLTSSAGAAPGTVTVTSTGSITVDGVGETAITVDSDHNVTNQGTLAATNVDGTGGIRIQDGHLGTITNSGQINFTDGYILTDSDNDGDFDGEFATGSGRYGILLESGTYTGNIINSGAINIEGNGSYGIRLNGRLDGDGTTTGNLNITSGISVIGDNSVAIAIEGGPTGGVAGDVNISTGITALGEGAIGMLVDSEIDGNLTISGNWQVTGFHDINRNTSVDVGDDDLIGGPALSVHYSIGGGIKLHGTGLDDDDDDDGDGTNDETDDNRTADITSYGTAPAILVSADAGVDVNLGSTGDPGGFGIYNLGAVTGAGVQNGVDSVAMRLQGAGGLNVTTAGGIYNEGSIFASAREGSATALSIGADTTVPLIHNRSEIQAVSTSQSTELVTGVLIESGADAVTEIRNEGTISASVAGETSNVVAIRDLSGTLTTITNTNAITTAIVATDGDPITGANIAIDVQNAISGVTITQNNGGDPDAATNQRIIGDILLGSSGDLITLDSGVITGDISFGLGLDTFNIDGGSTYTGAIDDVGEDLNIGILDGTMHLTGGNALISDGSFGAESTLMFDLSGDPLDDPMIEADTVTFVAGAQVVPVIPNGLQETTQVFLTANAMTGGVNVIGVIDGEGVPFLYDLEVSLTNPLNGDGLVNGLQATFEIKEADELGLTENQGEAFEPILEALRQDATASAAFISLDDQASFIDAYQDLMPSYASAAAEIATTAIQQMQSATSNRLAATRLHGLNEVSAWAQEIGYGLDRQPPTANGQEFRGHGFGMATGIDGPLDNGALFGISASFIASEVEEPSRADGEISASIGQLNAYLGTAMGPFDLDFIVGAGAGKMQSRRFVEIADTFSSLSEADWWAYEGHGAVRISAPMSLSDWMVVTPQAALTYVYLNEQEYAEEGGGAAIDYEVDSAASQRLWGDVGVEFSSRIRMGDRSFIAPRLFAGYRANLIDDDAERTFRFVSTGDEFTLTDEPLGDGGPLVGIGIDATNGYSTVALGYEGEFGDQIERHSLNVSVRFRF